MLLAALPACAALDCSAPRANPCAGHEPEVACVLGLFAHREAKHFRQLLDDHPSARTARGEVSPNRDEHGRVYHNQSKVAYLRAPSRRSPAPADPLHAELVRRVHEAADARNLAHGWNFSLMRGGSPEALQSVTYDAPEGWYGRHVDVTPHNGTAARWANRALSVIVQLADRDDGAEAGTRDPGADYAGGALQLETASGRVLDAPGCAGDAVIFPADRLWHRVQRVLAGRRRCLVYWVWHKRRAAAPAARAPAAEAGPRQRPRPGPGDEAAAAAGRAKILEMRARRQRANNGEPPPRSPKRAPLK